EGRRIADRGGLLRHSRGAQQGGGQAESLNFNQFTAFQRVSFSLFFNLMAKNKVSSLFRAFHPVANVLVGVMAGWLVGEIGVFRHFAQYLTNPLVFGRRCGVA
ncbi:hypothetical protein, partial [Brevundimonas sp. P7753]|uniref:hypothetical protein n=1 Tax=Brevundimonas sp. P7753 TaxID=2726982 RepID=UPI001C4D3520